MELREFTNVCIKDDVNIKNNILSISNKLDLRIDKIDYLENYIENNYTEDKINKDIESYERLLLNKIELLKSNIDNLSLYIDNDYISKVYDSLYGLLNSKNYDEIKMYLNIKLPQLPRGCEEEAKIEKEK